MFFGDPAIEEAIFASLCAGTSEPAVEPVGIDQCLAPNQRRTAAPDEIPVDDVAQHVTFPSDPLQGARYFALAVNPERPTVDKPHVAGPLTAKPGAASRSLLGAHKSSASTKAIKSDCAIMPTSVAGCRDAGSDLRDHAHAGVVAGMSVCHSPRVVGRSIVDDEDLERTVCLRPDAAQRLVEGGIGVVSGDDNAHELRVRHRQA